jgi:FKBP-type peptidyl-prolyl cis-trans isomerase FkpA
MYAVRMTKTPSRTLWLVSLVLALCACGNKGTAASSAPAALETEDQKTLYALGLWMGGQVKVFNLTTEELALVKKGLEDSVSGAKPQVEFTAYQQKLNELAQARRAAGATATKTKGKEFAEAAAKEAGATVLPSGIVYKTITPGTGPSPKATDTVKVHYEGKLIDGTVFDSSKTSGTPAEFALNGVVKCWTEGVQKMKVGEKARLVCPSDVAYGDGGQGPIPPGATLDFEVELLEIKK